MWRICVRLSIVGLPFNDNIRWTLLLGLWSFLANNSKPIVEFTSSRRTRREVSGSPLRNDEIASFIRDEAKSGSLSARSLTVCLKSRVSAIFSSSICIRESVPLLFQYHVDSGIHPSHGPSSRSTRDSLVNVLHCAFLTADPIIDRLSFETWMDRMHRINPKSQ